MLPAEFEYFRPETLDEALGLLKEHGDEAKLLAGGMSLIPMMKLRILSPSRLIDTARLPLSYIREDNGSVVVGGLTTHYALESSPLLAERLPLLAETAGTIGDVQVRNRGTIGGSLAHADPSADLPAAVLALNATVTAVSHRGTRSIPAAGLFQGMLTTSLEPDEMLTEIRFAAQPAGSGAAYAKAPHKASYFAVVGVAAVLSIDSERVCTSARVAVTGISFNAYRAEAVEAAIVGQKLDDATLEAAGALAAGDRHVMTDVWTSSDYRTHLTSVYLKRALRTARDRAQSA